MMTASATAHDDVVPTHFCEGERATSSSRPPDRKCRPPNPGVLEDDRSRSGKNMFRNTGSTSTCRHGAVVLKKSRTKRCRPGATSWLLRSVRTGAVASSMAVHLASALVTRKQPEAAAGTTATAAATAAPEQETHKLELGVHAEHPPFQFQATYGYPAALGLLNVAPWMPHDATVYHGKAPGGSYTSRSPLHYLEDSSISVGMKCIIHMTLIYCLVLSATHALQWWQSTRGTSGRIEGLLSVMQSCKHTIVAMPMLAVLFIATRIRAHQLAKALPTKYDLPGENITMTMALVTIAITVQLLLTLMTPVITGKLPDLDAEGNLVLQRDDNTRRKTVGVKAFLVLRLLCLAAVFSGGIYIADASDRMAELPRIEVLWRPSQPPKMSTAVWTVQQFANVFFAIFLVHGVIKILNFRAWDAIVQVATISLQLVPVLCVLILAARMRAIQIDPIAGAPQDWCQKLFYVSLGGVAVQVLSILLTYFFIGGTEDAKFRIKFPALFAFLNAVRFFALVVVYLCVGGVCFAISEMRAEAASITDIAHTPAMSAALMNILVLIFLYLAMHLLQYGTSLYRQVVKMDATTANYDLAMKWIDTARQSAMFVPIIVPFLMQSSLRARQLTWNTSDDYPTDGAWKIPVPLLHWTITGCVSVLILTAPLVTPAPGSLTVSITRAAAVGAHKKHQRDYSDLTDISATAVKKRSAATFAATLFRGLVILVMYVALGCCLVALLDPDITPQKYKPRDTVLPIV